jgi:proteasome accessory factor C
MNHIELLIRMLPWLVSHPGVSAEVVAKEFGITSKEVLKLLDLLQYTGPGQYGGELVDVHFGAGESIYVIDAQRFDRPVRMSGAEASTLLAGLTYLEQMPALADTVEVTELIDKISKALQPAPAVDVITNVREHECVELVKVAIEANKQVSIDYASGSATNASHRTIEPKVLLTRDDLTYVRAWCHEAEGLRTFRIDRIAHAELLDHPQSVEVETAELARSTDSWIAVTVELDREHLGEFDNDTVKSVTDLGDGRLRVESQVANLDWFVSVVLAGGGSIKVVEPAEARELVINRASSWLNS